MVGAMVLVGSSMVALADGSYTYCYDYWGDIQDSPDAYEVVGVYTSSDLGLDTYFKDPSGLTVDGNDVYIVDRGNNRIVQLTRVSRDKFELVRIIDEISSGTDVVNFDGPSDIAVSEDGNLFICDTNNARIVKLDKDLNLLQTFTKPTDETLDAKLLFQPDKLCVDTAERVYAIATGINKGLIKYEADGTFSGFVGATPVVYEWWDYIWKRLASQAQRAQMQSFVPTEYENVYMDHDGFIYTVTGKVEEDALRNESADAIRKLNMMGSDILIRNGDYPVYGDLYFGEGGGYKGSSLMQDITAFDNDIYMALDRNRGRIFCYNDQGRLLFAFGGNGNQDGYFRKPSAIDHMGYDLMVLDRQDNSMTLFAPTEYGQAIFDAIDQFDAGEYEKSGQSWENVMTLNGNYDLAYIGIGRSLLRQEEYKEAMEYFELKYDDENYSKAFKQYRKIWVEEHIGIIFAVVFLALAIPLGIGRVREIKHEIDIADIFRR